MSSRRQEWQPVDKNDELNKEASALCGATLQRLARGYEANPETRRDLLQEIHIELWRSLRVFDGRCSLQTWVYRVAHNVAASHIVRSRRVSDRLVDLDTLETEPGFVDGEVEANQRLSVSRLLDRIYRLKPVSYTHLDVYKRQVQHRATIPGRSSG